MASGGQPDVNTTKVTSSDKLETPIHHDFSYVRLATCIFATTTGEITLPALVKDISERHEDVFSEAEAARTEPICET
jgi:hypothetical protein